MTSQNSVRTYRDLVVWQEAMTLAEICYRLTAKFPREEIYGMTSQIRRAAVSIPANIAEGYARETAASYIQFLKIARGSLRELETHLLLSERVQLSNGETISSALGKCDLVGKLLHGLIRSLRGADNES